jgi:uncharacterized protein (TIGR02646 family)
MIQLQKKDLPEAATEKLAVWQEELNKVESYEVRVSEAKRKFESRNVITNPTFRIVRSTLTKICSGNRRCCYCEDSVADEVEHIRPKSLFPEQVFLWENYLYACGPCNGPKNNSYAVFIDGKSPFEEFVRKKDDPIVPPPTGEDVLIDPRKEDPLNFIELDIWKTFRFSEKAKENSKDWFRAKYTIDVLHLNDREYLVDGREAAFKGYRSLLKEYIQDKEKGATQDELDVLIANIKKTNHPTVWKEMQRFHDKHPDLKPLFEAAPEALAW